MYKDKESETESTKNINKNVSGNKSSSDLVKVYGATPNSDGSSNGNGNGTGADGEYSDSSSSLSVLSKHMRPLCSAPTYASVLHQYAKLLTRHLLYVLTLIELIKSLSHAFVTSLSMPLLSCPTISLA